MIVSILDGQDDKQLLLLHLRYIHSKDSTSYYRESCISMFITVLFKIARNQEQSKCPSTVEWIMTIWYMYTIQFHSFIGKT